MENMAKNHNTNVFCTDLEKNSKEMFNGKYGKEDHYTDDFSADLEKNSK